MMYKFFVMIILSLLTVFFHSKTDSNMFTSCNRSSVIVIPLYLVVLVTIIIKIFLMVLALNCIGDSAYITLTWRLSLSTVALNSSNWPKKWHLKFWWVQNPPYSSLYTKKSTKMHWYDYNNTVPLLNIAKSQIFHQIYNFKISKFSTISSARQPASLP